ncbi:MAG: YifB family Mg chelatase-like AAA ATPase [Chloroflexi bacterium]|nr:YifB family Mg chelatase-like AAA ATPase [Chloroflexota bacterium]
MLARVQSSAVVGLDGVMVDVEVDISRAQNPTTAIVGLPDAAVQESKERVRAAIRNSALTWPFNSRIVVNLAPADLRKEGPAYDLPIAAGVMVASGQVEAELADAVFVGELALDGEVRAVRGALPMVAVAHDRGARRAFVPVPNAPEAALVEGLEVLPVESLTQLAAHLLGKAPIAPYSPPDNTEGEEPVGPDLADVIGQEHAKRALAMAAAGGHNLLMRGPPGSGKTLLARAIPSILPPMTNDEALEVTRIYSVAGLLPSGTGLLRQRPFRAPHHTISHAGLVGGGSVPRPGEITLSHHGVLFLDELPEFGTQVLEVLRQPLEDRIVTISRARQSATFPASFALVAAQNPCPCGYLGDPIRECRCPANAAARYQRRVSGPVLDRIDIFIDVPRVDYEKLAAGTRGEPSSVVAERVRAVRAIQQERFAGTGTRLNAEMGPTEVREHAQWKLDEQAQRILSQATAQMALSARAFHRVLKVARTVADFEASDAIGTTHVAEALQYRERAE